MIWNSRQRAVVVHGTHDLQIEENIALNTKGHAFVLEDGVETGNTFRNNLAVHTQIQPILIPPDPVALNGVETDDQAAAFWITNANNSLVGNIVAGSRMNGIWLEALHRGILPMRDDPKKVALGEWRDNVVLAVPEVGVRFYHHGYHPNTLQRIEGLRVARYVTT